jgi:hypothetical protein
MSDLELAPTKRPIDDAAIERIVRSVGDQFVPADMNRTALREDIEYWGAWYDDALETHDRGTVANRKKHLKKMRKACDVILKANDDVWSVISATRQAFGPRDAYREHLCYTLQRLAVDIDRTFNPPVAPHLWAPDKDGLFENGSPFARLVGIHLKAVFEKHFPGVDSTSYTRSPDDGATTWGPYIFFAHECLIELKIHSSRGDAPYQCNSIADAVSDYRHRATR